MDDVIFIGSRLDVEGYRSAGIPSYAPPLGLLAERVLAERARCRVLAMTEETYDALPDDLARELREGHWPRLAIVPRVSSADDRVLVRKVINTNLARVSPAVA